MIGILCFLSAMWALLLAGGAVAVLVLGAFSVSGHGDLDAALTSAAKAATAALLVAAWVLALSKAKNWMFRRELRS